MTESLGDFLQSSRLKKGLTTIDVAEYSRVNIGFIKAIEDNQFGDLPGSVFIKGLLRNYSTLLEIDGDELVDRYNSLDIKHIDNTPQMISIPLTKDPAEPVKIILLALAGIGVIVGAVVYYFFGDIDVIFK